MKTFYGLDSNPPSQRAASGMEVWNDTLRLGCGGAGAGLSSRVSLDSGSKSGMTNEGWNINPTDDWLALRPWQTGTSAAPHRLRSINH